MMPAPWYIAGPLIGILIVLMLWVTNQPFGALGGYIEAVHTLSRKRPDVTWRTLFVLGVVAGGLLSTFVSGAWHPTLAYGSFDQLVGASLVTKALLLAGAGALMGAGGRLAGGCTSGHGLCGTSFGSPASFLCTATFMMTAIACALAVARLVGASS
jgi:uncharacterized membrane protein YedE/YeeE